MCMQLQLKKLFMGFHLKIKIIHRHVVGGEKKFYRLKISEPA